MTVRRTHPRHAAKVKLKISFPDVNEFQHVYTKNISKGGMFLATPKPLGKGTKVLVRLVPPSATKPFELEGEIAHSVDTPTAIKKKTTPGMGIKFVNLNAALKAALDLYIKDLLAGKVPADPPGTAPVPQPAAQAQARPRQRPAGAAAGRPAPPRPAARPAAGQTAAPAGATMPLHRPPAPGQTVGARPGSAPDPRKYIQHLDAATKALRTRNHYEFFGVQPTATRAEIRRAYNNLAKMFHPDRAPQVLSEADRGRVSKLFADIGEILDKLSDPRARVIYDLSIGVDREPESEEEAAVKAEERARFREAYVQQFPDRIQQAQRFAVMAEAAAGTGNRRAAANNYKLALSLDPFNDEYRAKMEALQG